jgi:uncharacterized protein (DUF1499 family)
MRVRVAARELSRFSRFADERTKVVHVRSALRIGRKDFGVNRARIEVIQTRFAGQ